MTHTEAERCCRQQNKGHAALKLLPIPFGLAAVVPPPLPPTVKAAIKATTIAI